MARTLRGRLTKLMFLFLVFSVSAFSGIYLKGQLDLAAEHNFYRAKLGGFIVKEMLGYRFSVRKNVQPEMAVDIFKTSMVSLVEAGLVKKAVLFSQDEKLLSFAGEYDEALYTLKPFALLGSSVAPSLQEKPFLTVVNEETRKIHVMIQFSVDPTYYAVLEYPLGTWAEAWQKIKDPIFVMTGFVCLIILILGTMISKAIIVPIKQINQVTKQVAAGNLEMNLSVETDDELGELSATFNEMTRQLVQMKTKAEDVNPLTKLPGNIMIMKEVENRLYHNGIFFVIYADLNNFKAFNDKYGIYAGDKVIKMTADVIQRAVSLEGTREDMVGHEGGDDFIVITTPEKAKAVAAKIIQFFDAQIRSFYVPGDLEKGSFSTIGRDGEIHQYPLMGIALAGVTNQHRKIESYAEMTHICAETKRKAKSFIKSEFYIDQRRA